MISNISKNYATPDINSKTLTPIHQSHGKDINAKTSQWSLCNAALLMLLCPTPPFPCSRVQCNYLNTAIPMLLFQCSSNITIPMLQSQCRCSNTPLQHFHHNAAVLILPFRYCCLHVIIPMLLSQHCDLHADKIARNDLSRL